MTQRLTKFFFTTHISFSIGWLGAVAVFLALAITALTTNDAELARSGYLAMEISTWYVIVPFSIASVATGLIQALGTKWGLFRYYWITVKLFITAAMTVLLLLHLQPIASLAGAEGQASNQETKTLIDISTKAGAALITLIGIVTISVYKPWGKIKESALYQDKAKRKIYLIIAVVAIIILVIVKHVLSAGKH